MKKKWLISILTIALLIIVMAGCGGGGSDTNVNLPGTLIITEIGGSYYADSAYWVEVYNNSSENAQLSNYKLRSMGLSTADWETLTASREFSLPSLVVPPGAYVVIRSKVSNSLVSAGNLVYVGDSIIPCWYENGFIELIKGGQTADFVRFGSNTESPTTAGQWTGSAAPVLADQYGTSIARDGGNTDTHSAVDWVSHTFATPGGPNDVGSDVDDDQDGIPDYCEASPDRTFAGLPLYAWGARTGQKDIFIHVDYMNSADPGIIPQKAALDKVRDAFAAHGTPYRYAVHFDVGDLYAGGQDDPANYNLDGRSHRVPYIQTIALDENGLYRYKNTYMPLAKRQIFHYMLMANSQENSGNAGSSGVAEINGNDLIITLGHWGLVGSPGTALNELVNTQAGTIMHEFGHNLGLMHGGNEEVNYKPNYYSIMNYAYQIYGLPQIGNNEGDRYYLWQWYYLNNTAFSSYLPSGLASLIQGPYDADMVIDYSSGNGLAISEGSVVESQGLRQAGSTGVDFNGDGDTLDTLPNCNLNNDGNSSGTLRDYNDWANINLFFFREYWGDTTGTSKKAQFKTVHDPVGNDRQKVTVETLKPYRPKKK